MEKTSEDQKPRKVAEYEKGQDFNDKDTSKEEQQSENKSKRTENQEPMFWQSVEELEQTKLDRIAQKEYEKNKTATKSSGW